jgi:tRNA-splicing ligase RtcB
VPVGGGADEAPEVYKRLPDVLAAHTGSVRVKHRLRPLGVAMGSRDVAVGSARRIEAGRETA